MWYAHFDPQVVQLLPVVRGARWCSDFFMVVLRFFCSVVGVRLQALSNPPVGVAGVEFFF